MVNYKIYYDNEEIFASIIDDNTKLKDKKVIPQFLTNILAIKLNRVNKLNELITDCIHVRAIIDDDSIIGKHYLRPGNYDLVKVENDHFELEGCDETDENTRAIEFELVRLIKLPPNVL